MHPKEFDLQGNGKWYDNSINKLNLIKFSENIWTAYFVAFNNCEEKEAYAYTRNTLGSLAADKYQKIKNKIKMLWSLQLATALHTFS
jgi:hypothetical protein